MQPALLILSSLLMALPAAENVAFGRIELRLVEETWLKRTAYTVVIESTALVVTVVDGGKSVSREQRVLKAEERSALLDDLLASPLLDRTYAAVVDKPALVLIVDPPSGQESLPRWERWFSAPTLDQLAIQGPAKRFFDRLERLAE